MSRHSCFVKPKLRKGLWSPEEDEKLLNHVTKFGHGCWSSVPKQARLQRCGKSCRLRWINYLRPDLKRGTFSEQEENLIIELHEALGNKWSQIASQLPGRTDNEIKNLWNSCIKKKLRQRGIDPNTHKPLKDDKIPVGIENMLVTQAPMAPTKELFSLEDPSPSLWMSHNEFNSNNVSSSSVPYNGNEMLSDNYSYDAGMYALNIEGGDEDLRWSEYLQGAFPVSATFNNQNQSMYSDVKTENHFALDELGNWQQSQQPQQLQNGEMYGKDFEIIPAVFGHI